jgi:predicted RNA-binding Zn ribbon-like protein
VLFSHDTEHWLGCVVDLASTVPAHRGDPDRLADLGALQAFVGRHDVSEVGPLTGGDLEDVRRLRDRVRPVFSAQSDAEAARLVNALIAEAPVTPRLTDHDGHAWHMHYFTPGAGLGEHLSVDCGIALAQVVALGERERLRTCEAPDCERVLVDLSRNRSRRYCDARTCGNRVHVAAYRERRRGDRG